MPRIFISYRREDSGSEADLIHEFMMRHFGQHNVFLDVESIPLGENFREYLAQQVATHDVVLVIIGPDWARIMEERAQQSNDFVRIEIESALEQHKLVIPVLVKHTTTPNFATLPASISDLQWLNMAEIRRKPDLADDCARLADDIRHYFRAQRTRPRWIYGVALVALILSVGILIYLWGGNNFGDSSNSPRQSPTQVVKLATDTQSPTQVITPEASPTSLSNLPTETGTEVEQPTNTRTPTFTPSETPEPSLTASFTDEPTQVTLPPNTDTDTATATPTDTRTYTPTFTNTYTATDTFTLTFTDTYTPPDTATATPTNTPTYTPTFTNTYTATDTFTPTFTDTDTATPTNTPSPTITPTMLGGGTGYLIFLSNRDMTPGPDAYSSFYRLDINTGDAQRTSGDKRIWAPSGEQFAYVEGNLDTMMYVLYIADRDGSNTQVIFSSDCSSFYGNPLWSPDSTRILITAETECAHTDIFAIDVASLRITNLTDSLFPWDFSPSWSPDGTRIVFISSVYTENGEDNGQAIFIMNADGTNRQQMTFDGAQNGDTVWSPNGQFIAYVSDRDGDTEIYIMTVDGFYVQQLTFNSAYDSSPAWSPDSELIAYVSNQDGDSEIYITNLDGSYTRQLTQNEVNDTSPRWEVILSDE